MIQARAITLIVDHLGAAGTQRQVAMLARELSRQGDAVDVVLLEPDAAAVADPDPRYTITACPVRRLDRPGALGDLLRLARHLRRTRPDVVHTFLLKANLVGAIAARLARVPAVAGSRRSLGYDVGRRRGLLLRLANLLVDGVVANDPSVLAAAAAREGALPPNGIVIPNGVQEAGVSHQTVGNGHDIGMLANVRPVKGHDLMLDALAQLRRRHDDVRLHLLGDVAGDPRWSAHIHRRIAALGLDHHVVWHRPGTSPSAFLAMIDVLAVPSRSEGLANALLEGMAHGLPVVATDVGGSRGALDQAGVVVPPDDPDALADALGDLLDHPGRRLALGRAAHDRATRHHAPARLAERHRTWYDGLLRTSRRPWPGGLWWRPRRTVLIAIDMLDTGGTEQQILVLTRELRRQGQDVAIACLRSGGRVARRLADDGVRVSVLGKRRRVDPLFLLRQQWLLMRMRPAAVVAMLTTAGIWTVPAARLAGVPRVAFSMRATALTDDPRATGPIGLLRRALALAHVVVGNSDEVLAYCRDALGVPAQRLALLPNTIDGAGLRHRPRIDVRRELGLPAAGPLIGIAARLVPVKDHGLFLETCACLRDLVPGLQAIIVGDGPERQAIADRIAARGLAGTVTMLGHRDDTPAVLRALDAMLLTSHSEGSPNAVLEALAVGTPVVSLAVGDVASLLAAGGGQAVPVRDPGLLAAAVHAELRTPTPPTGPSVHEQRAPRTVVAALRTLLLEPLDATPASAAGGLG